MNIDLRNNATEHQVDRNERTYALKLALVEAPFAACLPKRSSASNVCFSVCFVPFSLHAILSLSHFANQLSMCLSVVYISATFLSSLFRCEICCSLKVVLNFRLCVLKHNFSWVFSLKGLINVSQNSEEHVL